jgi:hypothetical protein
VLERLTRYARRAIHLPTTVASVDERIHQIETRLDLLSHSSAPAPSYTPAPHPTLRDQHVDGARLYANRFDALAEVKPNGRVAEIGVAAGDFTEAVLRVVQPERFDAIDIFQLHEWPTLWGRSTKEWFEGRTHREFYESRFEREIDAGVLHVFEGDSSAVMATRPDAYYDMIYIDGDHSFEGVLRDAEASVLKLKGDGLLIFNDYTMMDHVSASPYGIVPVVNEFCANRGWTVAYFALQHELFCDIALRRAH